MDQTGSSNEYLWGILQEIHVVMPSAWRLTVSERAFHFVCKYLFHSFFPQDSHVRTVVSDDEHVVTGDLTCQCRCLP